MKEIHELSMRDGRYSPEAFRFLLESLDTAIQLAGKADAEGKDRHVTGPEVLDGMVVKARSLFGPLAAAVWRSWGIHAPLDWGRVVFLLVEAELLNRQDSDTLEDFRIEMDFDAAFVDSYEPTVPELDR